MPAFFRFFLFIKRAFENAYRSILAIRWKSAISILTILIGSLAITTTFTISSNVDGYIQFLINSNGGPTVSVVNTSQDSHFSKEDISKLNKVSVVKNVYGTDESQVSFRFRDKNITLNLMPVTTDNWNLLPVQKINGSFISLLDQYQSPNTIVISSEAAKKFEMYPIIGQYLAVKLKGSDEIRLKIIGVSKKTSDDYDMGSAWVNFPLYREITGRKSVSLLNIVSRSSDWMNWTESFGRKLLTKKFGDNLWLINPLGAFLEEKQKLAIFIQMGYILGLLALVAGSIGSTSVMILNVNLRRREIGLYKSMGFPSYIILLQFTFETMILSLFGGVIGGVLGSFLGLVISRDMFPVANISILGFLLGVSVALVTGLVFGLIPAFLAAKIDPVKALQG